MKKVLIVEDDPGIIDAIGMILSEVGYEVMAETNSRKAMDLVEEFNPDLVILDMLMSGVDGREVCYRIKSDYESIPVIMISAHPRAHETVFDYGADDFLAKPFDLEELVRIASKYAPVS